MQKSVGPEVGELATKPTLEKPVDEKQRPRKVHHEVGADGTARKESEKQYVEETEDHFVIVLMR